MPVASDIVLVAGIPASWKGVVDRRARTIRGMVALISEATVRGTSDGRIVLDLVGSYPLQSYEGMSGGPVHSTDGRLIAVVTHQDLGVPTRLYAAPIGDCQTLVDPLVAPSECPTDLMCLGFGAIIPVRSGRRKFHMLGAFEHFISISQPDHRYGNFSRLNVIAFTYSSGSLRFRINCEAISYPTETEPLAIVKEGESEMSYFLRSTRISPDSDREQSTPPPEQALRVLAELVRDYTPGAGSLSIVVGNHLD